MPASAFPHPAQPVPPTLPVARRLHAADLSWAAEPLRQAVAERPAGQYVCAGPTASQPQQWLLTQVLGLGFELTGHCVVDTGPTGPLSTWGLLRPAPP